MYPESLASFAGLGLLSSVPSSSMPSANPVMTYAEPVATTARNPVYLNANYTNYNAGQFPHQYHHAVPVQEYGYHSAGSYNHQQPIPLVNMAAGGLPYNNHSNHYPPHPPYYAVTGGRGGTHLPSHYDESERHLYEFMWTLTNIQIQTRLHLIPTTRNIN